MGGSGKGGTSKGNVMGKGKGKGKVTGKGKAKGKGTDTGKGEDKGSSSQIFVVLIKDGDNGRRPDLELEVKSTDTIANVKAKITTWIGEPDGVAWYLESRGRGLEDWGPRCRHLPRVQSPLCRNMMPSPGVHPSGPVAIFLHRGPCTRGRCRNQGPRAWANLFIFSTS